MPQDLNIKRKTHCREYTTHSGQRPANGRTDHILGPVRGRGLGALPKDDGKSLFKVREDWNGADWGKQCSAMAGLTCQNHRGGKGSGAVDQRKLRFYVSLITSIWP